MSIFIRNQPTDEEEGAKHFQKYREWLGSLGDALISSANPLKDTNVITPDRNVASGSTTEISGFTVIQADTMQIAVELARSCPFLEIGGTLEVSEMMRMDG